MQVKNLYFAILLVLAGTAYGQADLSSVYADLEKGELLSALTKADSLLEIYPGNNELNFIKGDIYVSYGSSKVYTVIEELNNNGGEVYAQLLDLKTDLFIGSPEFDQKAQRLAEVLPQNVEMPFLRWLGSLDKNHTNFIKNAGMLINGLSMMTPRKYLPLLALYYYSWDVDNPTAYNFLQTLRDNTAFRMDNEYHYLDAVKNIKPIKPLKGKTELVYGDFGPYFGIILKDKRGKHLSLILDTGTSGYKFTVHKKNAGAALDGKLAYKVEKGIQFNYMSEPADVFGKLVEFKEPQIEALVEYFEGGLGSSDGTVSPLAFKNMALTVDPFNKKVTLRDKKELDKYVSSLDKNKYTEVDYITRKGWMYIPCKVNGKEVLMLVESGSRDVNLNKMAINKFGWETYEAKNVWKGKESMVEKIDCELKVGDFDYTVKGGFVSDYALGNLGFGLGAAGDIGPDFLKHYVFTFDNINRKLILEKP